MVSCSAFRLKTARSQSRNSSRIIGKARHCQPKTSEICLGKVLWARIQSKPIAGQ